jgi:DNA-binding CsgD family transcriptional regulator
MPYNSGMVDVDMLQGSLLTDRDNDSLLAGIQMLRRVAEQGTTANRAKAYHQLAQTYLRRSENRMAEVMLDSLYVLLNHSDVPIYISIDYEPILRYYHRVNNHSMTEQYTKFMLKERQAFKAKRLNYNLVESIVKLQTEQKNQELRIMKLRESNQRLMFMIIITLAIVIILVVSVFVLRQRKYYINQMKRANEKSDYLIKELNQSNIEKEKITQDIKEFLKDTDNRQELEILTPFVLKDSGEIKFRQCFELLHPHFLHRLRERVPSITRREELLSMLIVLKQGTKEISELLSIAPRSVLMLRHRFRQKIGMDTEVSLENFIENILGELSGKEQAIEAESNK